MLNSTIVGAEILKLMRLVGSRASGVYIALSCQADRDGIVRLDSGVLHSILSNHPVTRRDRVSIASSVKDLCVKRLIIMYEVDGIKYAWIPHVPKLQPSRGKMSRSRNHALPPPPKESVTAYLEAEWGRSPSIKEAQSASPRTWGRASKATGVQGPPEDDVISVWKKWQGYQKKPGACRLGVGAKQVIKKALGESDANSLIVLLEFAFEADDRKAKYWRGETADNSTIYLGLDNIFRITKLAGRVSVALQWKESSKAKMARGGDDLGPMAMYRSVPRGTTTTPSPRPQRLSAQNARILEMFKDSRGQLNTNQLASVARKYSARISELRGHGAAIECTQKKADGNNTYFMHNWETFNAGD